MQKPGLGKAPGPRPVRDAGEEDRRQHCREARRRQAPLSAPSPPERRGRHGRQDVGKHVVVSVHLPEKDQRDKVKEKQQPQRQEQVALRQFRFRGRCRPRAAHPCRRSIVLLLLFFCRLHCTSRRPAAFSGSSRCRGEQKHREQSCSPGNADMKSVLSHRRRQQLLEPHQRVMHQGAGAHAGGSIRDPLGRHRIFPVHAQPLPDPGKNRDQRIAREMNSTERHSKGRGAAQYERSQLPDHGGILLPGV